MDQNKDSNSKVFRGKCHSCNEKGTLPTGWPKQNLKNKSYGTGKGTKFNGSARCAEKQGSEDMFVNDEELPV